MQKQIELDGTACRIARNGDLSFVPRSRYPICLLMACAGLLGAWLWVKDLGIIIATLLLVCATVVWVLWANQPKVRILAGSEIIEWRRWFRIRQCSFVEVSRIEVYLDQQVYGELHLTYSQIMVEQHARLELILKDGSRLPLGKVTGKHVDGRVLALAESVARLIQVPVSNTGNVSKNAYEASIKYPF